MKLLLDFLPLLLFFVTFKYADGQPEWAAAFATEHLGFLVSGGKVGPTKGRTARTVDLPAEAVDLLGRWWGDSGRACRSVGCHGNSDTPRRP